MPHSLHVVQNVGGDGVDTDGDGVPDGVGLGVPFRVQPAIVIRGNGYLFNQSWGQHGFVPVKAIIHASACGGDCSNASLRLLGNHTPVLGQDSTFSEALFNPILGEIGMLWSDLQVTAGDNSTQLDIRLTFLVASYTTEVRTQASVDSVTFDAFSAPDPPINLRVSSYNTYGFRYCSLSQNDALSFCPFQC